MSISEPVVRHANISECLAHIELEDAMVISMLNVLHEHMPEIERPSSFSDLSDEQTARARKAVRLVLSMAAASPVAAMGERETGWLIEEHDRDGPMHYISLVDPRKKWSEDRERSRRIDWEPSAWSHIAGLIHRTKDANEATRFARKVDAEAVITAFGRMLLTPVAAEHMWPARAALEGEKL